MRRYRFLLILWLVFFVVMELGCDAFVRKFTRKPKKEDLPQEEMILAPEEYKAPVLTKEEQYRQYFLFWKSWQDELLEALLSEGNHKKQVSCADEAIKNLEQLRILLSSEDKQKKLDVYLNQLKELKDSIARDVYGSNSSSFRLTAEKIKRAVLRDFSYNKIKDGLL